MAKLKLKYVFKKIKRIENIATDYMLRAMLAVIRLANIVRFVPLLCDACRHVVGGFGRVALSTSRLQNVYRAARLCNWLSSYLSATGCKADALH